MKLKIALLSAVLTLCICPFATAQAPAGAPAGSTGMCNDGSYSTAASKSGACRGHKGIKTWYAADSAAPKAPKSSKADAAPAAAPAPAAKAAPMAAPAPAAAPAATPAPAPKAAPAAKSTSTAAPKTVAPGGGPGLVWLNTSSNVYHCSGDKDYGTTKAGKYLSESAAKAAGGHASHGKGCS